GPGCATSNCKTWLPPPVPWETPEAVAREALGMFVQFVSKCAGGGPTMLYPPFVGWHQRNVTSGRRPHDPLFRAHEAGCRRCDAAVGVRCGIGAGADRRSAAQQ